jgi:hypothetical protein
MKFLDRLLPLMIDEDMAYSVKEYFVEKGLKILTDKKSGKNSG